MVLHGVFIGDPLLDNGVGHQCTRDPDKHMEQGLYNGFKEMEMKVLIDYTNNEMKALNRHFNMVLEEVMETWADLANKDRFIYKMFLKGDSVVLINRLRPEMKEIDVVYQIILDSFFGIVSFKSISTVHLRRL